LWGVVRGREAHVPSTEAGRMSCHYAWTPWHSANDGD
jgi:hypothetical protein